MAYFGTVIRPEQSASYMVEVKARWNDEDYLFRFNVAAEK